MSTHKLKSLPKDAEIFDLDNKYFLFKKIMIKNFFAIEEQFHEVFLMLFLYLVFQ